MDFQDTSVGLLSSHQYQRKKLKEQFDTLTQNVGFSCSPGSRVLLKPNLVSVNIGYADPACTHPEFIAAAAEWFLDHGALVSIGDSPAFGTARQVLKMTGALRSLDGLPVRYVNFRKSRNFELPACLKPVSFNPVRMGISASKRLWDRCFPGSRRAE